MEGFISICYNVFNSYWEAYVKRKDLVLALVVVIAWGTNFTVIKLGLEGIPSTLLVAVRYAFVMFPAIFFVKKPNISFKYILAYGFTVGVGQFACLFYAIEIGMPAGLASIILQLQAFITPLFSFIFFKERLGKKQLAGFAVASIGLIVIALASTAGGISSIPLSAFILLIAAPIFWSASNIVSRYAANELVKNGEDLDTLGLVVWSSIVPPIPMIGISLLIYSPHELINSFSSLNYISIFSVLYLSFVSTLFGYGVWNSLISRYPLSKISPLSLLVPIFGLLVSGIVLSEKLSALQWIGVSVILVGLAIANFKLPLNQNKAEGGKLQPSGSEWVSGVSDNR
jgi:O-acetylserine/cysteine efflux transporter